MEHKLIGLADYEPLVGTETIERIYRKARALRDVGVTHLNATYYSGGVAEMLSSITLLMNSVGIPTEWRVLLSAPDFLQSPKRCITRCKVGH